MKCLTRMPWLVLVGLLSMNQAGYGQDSAVEIALDLDKTASSLGCQLDWNDHAATPDLSLVVVRIRRTDPTSRELAQGADLALVFVDFPEAGIPPRSYVVRVYQTARASRMVLVEPQSGHELPLPTDVSAADANGYGQVDADCQVIPHDDGTLNKICCLSVEWGPFAVTGCISATSGN